MPAGSAAPNPCSPLLSMGQPPARSPSGQAWEKAAGWGVIRCLNVHQRSGGAVNRNVARPARCRRRRPRPKRPVPRGSDVMTRRWKMDRICRSRAGARSPPLFILSLDSGQRRRITNPPEESRGDRFPAFSPDWPQLFSRVTSQAVSCLAAGALEKFVAKISVNP